MYIKYAKGKKKKQEGKASYCLVSYRLIPIKANTYCCLVFCKQWPRQDPSRLHTISGPQTYEILKLSLGSFGMDFVLLTKGSILDSCNDI